MRPSYIPIQQKAGAHNGGICSVKAIPREWVNSVLDFNFNTGVINSAFGFTKYFTNISTIIDPPSSITSIIINGTTYTAPAGLLLTNAAPITAWLNSLNKGIFVATYFPSENTLSIVTNSNANIITSAVITGASSDRVVLFSSEEKSFINLQFAPDSYSFVEKPKRSRSGLFFETSVSGLINYIDASLLQVLETLRHHEFILLVKDRSGNNRLIGTKDEGALMEIGFSEKNSNGGVSEVTVEFTIQTAKLAPIYPV